MKVAPALAELETYPFVRLTEAKRRLLARGVDLIDFGMGEPREETPAFIREALAAALEPRSTYPQSDGLPELRAAIAGWIERRFGAAVDRDAQVPSITALIRNALADHPDLVNRLTRPPSTPG